MPALLAAGVSVSCIRDASPRLAVPSDRIAPLRTISVADSSALSTALAAILPGDRIVLADGVYEGDFHVQKGGSAEAPVVIVAARRGGARFAGDARLRITGAEHVTVEGMTFTQGHTVALTSCRHVRLTRNHFRLAEPSSAEGRARSFHWTIIRGAGSHRNRIDHNLFETKRVVGHFVTIDGSRDPALASQHDRIDHNHFRDVGPFGEGMETIRIGFSGMSMSSAHTVVERNLFEGCSGDLEIVSVKACDNVVRYNTIVASEGALTARHGHRNHFIGNVVLGRGRRNTGGVRVYGDDHRIVGNYFEGLDDERDGLVAVKLDNGNLDHPPPYADDELVKHFRVHRAVVAFNTLVNNRYGLQIGSTSYEAAADGTDPATWPRRPMDPRLSPKDCVIANNLVVGAAETLVYQVTEPENLRWVGNLFFPAGGAADPRLLVVDGLFKLSPGSPAIDRAVGSFPEVVDDIDGQPRKDPKDVGADEWSNAPVKRRPLTAADVGIDAPL